MPAVWDTSLVSRLRPGSDALANFERTVLTDHRPLIPTASIVEVVFGHERRARSSERSSNLLVWLAGFLGRPDVGVVPLTAPAAIAAGRLRAAAPFPPRPKRSDRRSKPARRVAWVLDIHIAATAWSFGVPVATENVADFERLSELLAELYPRAKPLEVLPSPL